MATLYARNYAGDDTPITLGTRVNVGNTDILSCKHSKDFIFATTITLIGTNVVVQYQGSIDGTNWFNLDVRNVNTTYTANGTYYKRWNGEIPYLRCRLVSYSSGTPVVVFAVSIARIS